MYHELEGSDRPVSHSDPGYIRYVVRTTDFHSQMELLHSKGWRGVSVGGAVSNFSEKTVAITFDDGCETDLLYAAPALKEFNFGATFYITTAYLGKPGHLTQSQLRELSQLNFEIGCHSETHAYLTDLNDQDLDREITAPKRQLEQLLGKSVDHFSCPGGRHNQRVSEAARAAGYRTLATSRFRKNFQTSDPFALSRVPVMRSTPRKDFERMCEGRNLRQLQMLANLRAASQKLLGNSLYDRLRSAILDSRLSS